MTVLVVVWIACAVVVMAWGWKQASQTDAVPENDLALRRRLNAIRDTKHLLPQDKRGER